MASVIRGSDNFDSTGGNAVKAWVNFNGTGTVAIRAAFNVSSITDNGVGDYTVNFSAALADSNFAVCVSIDGYGISNGLSPNVGTTAAAGYKTAGTTRIRQLNSAGAAADYPDFNAAVFR